MDLIPYDEEDDEYVPYPIYPMNLIEPGLYLGDLNAAENSEIIRSYNIKKIVSLLESFTLCKTIYDVEYLRIEIPDSQYCDIIQYLPDFLKSVSYSLRNNENVLVHCMQGMSRSPSMVIAYIMVKYNMKFDEAYEFVRLKRKGIWPNEGFQKQLRSINIENYKMYLEDGLDKLDV